MRCGSARRLLQQLAGAAGACGICRVTVAGRGLENNSEGATGGARRGIGVLEVGVGALPCLSVSVDGWAAVVPSVAEAAAIFPGSDFPTFALEALKRGRERFFKERVR
jgi:hypothetical protein